MSDQQNRAGEDRRVFVPQTRPVVSDREIILILAHFLREPTFLRAARGELKPELFNGPDELPYRILVACAAELSHRIDPGTALHYTAIYQWVAQRAFDTQYGISDDDARRLLATPDDVSADFPNVGLIHAIYDIPADAFDVRTATDALQRLLHEREVDAPIRDMINRTGADRRTANLQHTLGELARKAASIEAIGVDPFVDAMGGNWMATPIERYQTGVGWIDETMGGQAFGDINGLLGMFGGGKSTTGAQLMTSCARSFRAMGLEAGTRPRCCVYVTYEEPAADIQKRILANIARIPKFFIEEVTDLSQLSRTGHLRDYEARHYDEMGITSPAERLGEQERLELAQQRFAGQMQVLDMRETGRGYGWTDELEAVLRRKVEEEGIRLGLVVVDYCKAMVQRHLHANGLQEDRHLRHKINATPLQIKQGVAEQLNCTVWLFHQFSGEANKRRPGQPMASADAGEARNFAENLVFCAAIGARDNATNMVRVDITKARRRGVSGTHRILKLNGDFQEFVLAPDFTIHNGQFVERNILSEFSGPAPTIPIRRMGGGINFR